MQKSKSPLIAILAVAGFSTPALAYTYSNFYDANLPYATNAVIGTYCDAIVPNLSQYGLLNGKESMAYLGNVTTSDGTGWHHVGLDQYKVLNGSYFAKFFVEYIDTNGNKQYQPLGSATNQLEKTVSFWSEKDSNLSSSTSKWKIQIRTDVGFLPAYYISTKGTDVRVPCVQIDDNNTGFSALLTKFSYYILKSGISGSWHYFSTCIPSGNESTYKGYQSGSVNNGGVGSLWMDFY